MCQCLVLKLFVWSAGSDILLRISVVNRFYNSLIFLRLELGIFFVYWPCHLGFFLSPFFKVVFPFIHVSVKILSFLENMFVTVCSTSYLLHSNFPSTLSLTHPLGSHSSSGRADHYHLASLLLFIFYQASI